MENDWVLRPYYAEEIKRQMPQMIEYLTGDLSNEDKQEFAERFNERIEDTLTSRQ